MLPHPKNIQPKFSATVARPALQRPPAYSGTQLPKKIPGNSELLELLEGGPISRPGPNSHRAAVSKYFLEFLLTRPDGYAGIAAVARARGAGVWGLVFVPPWMWRARAG